MSSPRSSTPREQLPLRSRLPRAPSTPETPPPAYTEHDERRARRHFITQDPRNNTSPLPPGPMTVPIIVITQATNRCESKFCKKRAVGGSSYCRKHECHVESCMGYREIGEAKVYCPRHGCRWPECTARAAHASRYCAEHKCRQASCVAARLSSTERSFCAFHACQRQGCEMCRGHTCQARGCARGTTASGALCRRHRCETHGCQALRPAHADRCPRHQCEVGDCQKGQVDGSRYCGAHKCGSDGCPVVRKRGLRHCVEHRGRSAPDEEAFDSSARHRDPCQERRSLRPRKNFVGGHSSYARRCRWGGCPGPALGRDGYCRAHTCTVGDCGQRVLEEVEDGDDENIFVGEYCRRHACAAEGCALRVSRGAYCSRHECRARPGCPNSRFWTDDRGAYREHAGCRFHTCVQRGCYDPTPRPGGLCGRHDACAWGPRPCLAARCGRSRYCEDHACRKSGCVSSRMPGGAYCPDHACGGSVPCPRKSETGSLYCARHECNQPDCRLERALGMPSCEKHRYSCDVSPFYSLSSHRRLVVPLR